MDASPLSPQGAQSVPVEVLEPRPRSQGGDPGEREAGSPGMALGPPALARGSPSFPPSPHLSLGSRVLCGALHQCGRKLAVGQCLSPFSNQVGRL